MKRLMVVLFAGLLVISACSDDDGGDSADSDESTTSTTEEEAEAISLDEWVEQADEICQEAEDAGDELPDVESISDLAEQAPDALEIFQTQYDDLVALEAPRASCTVSRSVYNPGGSGVVFQAASGPPATGRLHCPIDDHESGLAPRPKSSR